MFAPVGRGQQVVAAGEPSSSRNGSRSEIRLYKCEGWEHTGATEDGTGCGWCQKETGGLPAPRSPRHPEVVLDGEIRAYKREEWEHTGADVRSGPSEGRGQRQPNNQHPSDCDNARRGPPKLR